MSLTNLKYFLTKLLLNTKKKKLYFEFPNISSELENILKILQSHHFIMGYKINKNEYNARVFLAYDKESLSVITDIKFVSKVSQRQIISQEKIKSFLQNYPFSLALTRTSQGILTFQECQKRGCGGEFLVIIS